MNLTKKENGDYVTYIGIVNKLCERFKLDQLAIILVEGLTATSGAEIGAKILTKAERNRKPTLQEIADECLENHKSETRYARKWRKITRIYTSKNCDPLGIQIATYVVKRT